MKNVQTAVIGLVILFTFHTVDAQSRLSLHINSGAAFATQKLGDADLSTGFGFEGTVAYRFMPHLATYAGWSWNQFSADQSFAGANVHFEDSGLVFGLLFIHPLAGSKFSYLIQAGGIYNQIKAENDDDEIKADIIAKSTHGLGWQIGAGLVIPIGERWNLMTSVRYRSLSREIEVADVKTAVDLNYVSAGVGLSWSF